MCTIVITAAAASSEGGRCRLKDYENINILLTNTFFSISVKAFLVEAEATFYVKYNERSQVW